MKLALFLNAVKANRFTYYNLNQESREDFKKKYEYLKKHKDKEVFHFGAQRAWTILRGQETDYVKKIKAMDLLSTSIVH